MSAVTTEDEKVITSEILEKATDYQSHIQEIAKLYQQDKTTNGDNRQKMLAHTKMYLQRVSRWDRKGTLNIELIERLRTFPEEMTWLVLNEGWCGDSSQTLPFINKMAEVSENITLKIILRDENPEVMDEFLTNGSRSIPKLVALDSETLEVLGSWGPRPKEAYEMYKAERVNPDIPNDQAMENLHLWYAKDKGRSVQQEFLELLEKWEEDLKNKD